MALFVSSYIDCVCQTVTVYVLCLALQPQPQRQNRHRIGRHRDQWHPPTSWMSDCYLRWQVDVASLSHSSWSLYSSCGDVTLIQVILTSSIPLEVCWLNDETRYTQMQEVVSQSPCTWQLLWYKCGQVFFLNTSCRTCPQMFSRTWSQRKNVYCCEHFRFCSSSIHHNVSMNP